MSRIPTGPEGMLRNDNPAPPETARWTTARSAPKDDGRLSGGHQGSWGCQFLDCEIRDKSQPKSTVTVR